MNIKEIYNPNNDPLLPNYLALLACILHEDMSVSEALALMGISPERGERE